MTPQELYQQSLQKLTELRSKRAIWDQEQILRLEEREDQQNADAIARAEASYAANKPAKGASRAEKMIVSGAIGAGTGALAGAPFGGYGAIPGALIGGALGAFAGYKATDPAAANMALASVGNAVGSIGAQGNRVKLDAATAANAKSQAANQAMAMQALMFQQQMAASNRGGAAGAYQGGAQLSSPYNAPAGGLAPYTAPTAPVLQTLKTSPVVRKK